MSGLFLSVALPGLTCQLRSNDTLCMYVSNSVRTHFEVLFALVTHLHPAHLAHQHILTVVQHPPIYSVYLQAVTQMLSCGCF